MKDRIQQLEKEFEVAKESLQRMRDRLSDLKDSDEEFEEGQWIHAEGNAAGEYLFRYGHSEGDAYLNIGRGYKNVGCSRGWKSSTMRPATEDEIKEALIAEAKRRGLDTSRFECLEGGSYLIMSSSGKFYYSASKDTLFIGHRAAYKQGQWAEKIEDTVTINGERLTILDHHIEFDCGERIHVDDFLPFLDLVQDYDLTVHRQGEDITPQIKKLGELV